MPTLRYRAVFFDLDDTLFDHQAHRREALAALKYAAGLNPAISVASLEAAHERHLQRTHSLLLAGGCTLKQARLERLQGTLADHGVEASGSRLAQLETIYRRAYDRDWRHVPGSIELLDCLRGAGAWIGVVTNGREVDQVPKMERLGLVGRFDGVLISEVLGCEKPSLEFFAKAASSARVDASECVVVGDLWNTDIVGAVASGMSAIWLNRYGREPQTDAAAIEINSFRPLKTVLNHFLRT
jgi:HAD superfamily hydrolase (TIGR01509 family)